MLLKRVSEHFPVRFVDHGGEEFEFYFPPKRVVCLTPSITEIIRELGREDLVVGITYYDKMMKGDVSMVGGFLMPSVQRIQELNPDVIFYSPLQEHILEEFSSSGIAAVMLAPDTLEELFDTIMFLACLFENPDRGKGLVETLRGQIEHIQKKLEKFPSSRPRIIRIMGREGQRLIVPGNDSFQTLVMRLAGGEPPAELGEGSATTIDVDKWIEIDPEVIYGCDGDKKIVSELCNSEGWREVSAIREGRCFFYPCELTCRLSVRVGTFISRLASDIYVEEFSRQENWIKSPGIIGKKKIKIPLGYVKDASIITSHVFDFENKSLLIEFLSPLTVISTLEGMRNNILFVGNHYTPPQCWSITHYLGLSLSRTMVYKCLGLDDNVTSFLFTGVDMDNFVLKVITHKNLEVWVLLTAGVESNAQRMSRDRGDYWEVGTINMIIMTNMKLSPRAMTRAIITATEAKTAALQDMDIRSSYVPLENQATGTGTDNIIVVEGMGNCLLDNAGGHSKLGELIAKGVYEATISAIGKQNLLSRERHIFARLMERNISIFSLIQETSLIPSQCKNKFLHSVDEILMEDRYSSFMDICFLITDAYTHRGLPNPSFLKKWALDTARDIASCNIPSLLEFSPLAWPLPLRFGIDALFTGVFYRLNLP